MSSDKLDHRVRAAKALGLGGFSTGNHVIEVNPGVFQSARVSMLWVAKYSAGREGIVAVAHIEAGCRGIYLPATRMGRSEPPVSPVILQDWTDPVIGALKSINLIPVNNDSVWWGDGFSFDFELITFSGLDTRIHFSNNIHFDPSMEWLWDSITDTSARILHSYDEATQQLIRSLEDDDDDFTDIRNYFG